MCQNNFYNITVIGGYTLVFEAQKYEHKKDIQIISVEVLKSVETNVITVFEGLSGRSLKSPFFHSSVVNNILHNRGNHKAC